MSFKLKSGHRFLNLPVTVKRPVLSNKSLTKRVRGLTGNEGRRKVSTQKLYDGVTLTANDADINYMTTLNALSNSMIHSVRFWINYVAVANGFTRIIVFEDTDKGATNLLVAAILTEEVPHSSYVVNLFDVHPFSAKRLNKNLGHGTYRCRILKDILWSNNLNSGATKAASRQFDIQFNGRKTDTRLEWGVLVISSQADTPVDINYSIDFTDFAG